MKKDMTVSDLCMFEIQRLINVLRSLEDWETISVIADYIDLNVSIHDGSYVRDESWKKSMFPTLYEVNVDDKK